MAKANSLDETLEESFKYGSSALSPTSYQATQQTFLFGYPITHSLAPLLHSTLFKSVSLGWKYELHETQDASEFLPTLRRPSIIGCAITMPYKVTMMSSVDAVTDEGKTIGAINTVFLRKNTKGIAQYIGTNTDCIGVREAFLQNFPGILEKSTGKPGMVIGGGGACRAAIYALWKWMGVSTIYMVNRLETEVRTIMKSFRDIGFDAELVWVGSLEKALALESPVLIVGTVPDFPPKTEEEIIARQIVQSFLRREQKGFVLDMCYHPKPETEFYNISKEAEWEVIHGTESMIWQGVAQQVLWTELPFDKFDLTEATRFIKDKVKS